MLPDNESNISVYTNETVDVKASVKHLDFPFKLIAAIFTVLVLSTFIYFRYIQKPQLKSSPVEASYLEGAYQKFPVYPGSEETFRNEKKEDGKTGFEASWETSATPGQVITYYMNEAEGDDVNWLIMQKPDRLDQPKVSLIGEYLEKEFHLTATQEKSKTTVTVDFPLQ